MALRDSATGKTIREYSIEELKDAARLMRGYNLVALHAAGSGHSGGTLSVMDLAAALYLRVAQHDPKNPAWPDRDRIVWSAGHKAPSLYLGLAFAGGPDNAVAVRPGGILWIVLGHAQMRAAARSITERVRRSVPNRPRAAQTRL